MGAEGFGGWLRIWVPLIKLEGNCGGRGVWRAPRMRGCPGVGLGDKLFTVVIQ